jgi:hypothetical protein
MLWLVCRLVASEESGQWSRGNVKVEVKVKQFLHRPGQALRILGGSQYSRQSAHEGDKVVSLAHQTPLPPENTPGTHFC